MTEPKWKLVPKLNLSDPQVVWRRWDDGREESCFDTTPEYLAWVAEGNEAEEWSAE